MPGGRLQRQLVTPLLDTDDPALQQQALAVISKHSGWADETLTLLERWLRSPNLTEQQASILRGFLVAQAADVKLQQLLASALDDPRLPLTQRLLLLEVIDRCFLEPLPDTWIEQLGKALQHGEASVRMQALHDLRGRKIDRFDEQLLGMAIGTHEPDELRVEALAVVAPRVTHWNVSQFAYLVRQATEWESPLLQLAAARTITEASLSDPQLVDLTGLLPTASPMVGPVLLRAFEESHDEQVGRKLVAALNQTPILIAAPAELATLLTNYPPSIHSAAKGLLERLDANLEQRQARLVDLRSLLGQGNAVAGRTVFFSKKAACSTCHTVQNEGGHVGPDLTAIGAIRTGSDLLEALVFPSASFARGFRPYTVVTSEGLVYSGIISRETADSVYLRTAELDELRIPRDSIEAIRESSTSIMPQGLDQTLTQQELRNLLAFLQQLTTQ